jgi:hypothetical protein
MASARQSVHGTVSEVELRPVARSFSKSSKSGDRQSRLGFIKRNDFAYQFVN